MQPAVLDCVCRRLLIPEVAEHDVGPAHRQLALLAHAQAAPRLDVSNLNQLNDDTSQISDVNTQLIRLKLCVLIILSSSCCQISFYVQIASLAICT